MVASLSMVPGVFGHHHKPFPGSPSARLLGPAWITFCPTPWSCQVPSRHYEGHLCPSRRPLSGPDHPQLCGQPSEGRETFRVPFPIDQLPAVSGSQREGRLAIDSVPPSL